MALNKSYPGNPIKTKQFYSNGLANLFDLVYLSKKNRVICNGAIFLEMFSIIE